MGILTSENWAELLTPGLRSIFHLRLQNRESLYQRSKLYADDTSSRAYEEILPIGEMDSADWDFEDSGRVQYGEFEKGYKARWTHIEFAKGFTVRRKLVDDNLYPEAEIPKTLTQQVVKLADNAALQRERAAASLFNGAFTDSGKDVNGFPYAGPDAVGLCSAAHPLSPTNTGDTQANEDTDALSFTSVRDTKIAMQKFTDDKGEPIAISPDEILIPPELSDTAFRINNSELLPGSAENDVNQQKGRWNIVEWQFLTDSGHWFMMDSTLRNESLIWFERVPLEFDAVGDFDTLQMKWRAYMRYSRYWADWRWIYGQAP
jgi:Mu-like prophage major head subunit gpT